MRCVVIASCTCALSSCSHAMALLATFSCSHHVNEAVFAQTIADALVDAHRSARRLRRFEQALDHPVLPTLPETEYFKGVLLEMMPGR